MKVFFVLVFIKREFNRAVLSPEQIWRHLGRRLKTASAPLSTWVTGSTCLVLAVGLRACASVWMQLVLHKLAIQLGQSFIQEHISYRLALGVDDLLDPVVLVVTLRL